MRVKVSTSLLTTLCVGLLISCQNHEFTVNNQVVYTPPSLFSDYRIDDPALTECVRKNIEEQRLRKAEDLTRLLCSAGAIRELSGLEVFSELEQLGLGNNHIVDIHTLATLTHLHHLNLQDNEIVDAAVLSELPALQSVNLSGNQSLDCSSVKLASRDTTLPQHCR